MTSRRHGVDQQPVAAVEAEHDDLETPAVGVEAEAYLTCRVVLVQVTDDESMLSGVHRVVGFSSVLACGVVNLHAT